MSEIIVAPSILSADFKHLEEEIKKVEEAGAKWLHFDVMDGHFVPNISFGIPVLKSIKDCHHMVNDVHIMISNPKEFAAKFIEAGADYLTFHFEACKNIYEARDIIELIHEKGAKAGISIKPKTKVEEILPLLKYVDMVLVMSVEPGFGGQEFMDDALGKIFLLQYHIKKDNLPVLIEVDGGINEITGRKAIFAGANVLVAGSYLFGHDDVKERIRKIQ